MLNLKSKYYSFCVCGIFKFIIFTGDDITETDSTTSQKALHTTKDTMLETTQQDFHSSSDKQNLTFESVKPSSTASPKTLQTTSAIKTSFSTSFSSNLPTLISSKGETNNPIESLSTLVTTKENFTGTVTSNATSTTNVTN